MELLPKATKSSRERIQWIVRQSRLEDEDSIGRLFQESFETLLPRYYDASILEKALPKLCGVRSELLTCGTWYVVEHPEEPGTIVGCGGWTPESPMSRGDSTVEIPHLRHFATHPDYTRMGIGREVWSRSWKEACEYCKSHGGGSNDNPIMEVFSTLSAVSFYESVGFAHVKEVEIPLAEDCQFPAILMRRDPNIPIK